MKNKLAIVISDVHYSLNTYKIADIAFREAIDKASQFNLPLIDNGDLTNDKAILRAECVNTLINTMLYAKQKKVKIYLNIGNHSLLNEKSKEHALHFLEPYATILDSPKTIDGFNFIPYQSKSEDFYSALSLFPKNSIVFGHQGTLGGQLGDYIKDSSAIDPQKVLDWKLFLGHYHDHYTLFNTISIGNPYTLTFGEAKDKAKGFLILNEDGSFTREILNLRKHIILNRDMQTANDPVEGYNEGDLVWLKLSGSKVELDQLNKTELGLKLFGHSNFKLDLFPIEENNQKQIKVQNQQDWEILDSIIDASSHDDFIKEQLKAIYRGLNET